MRASFKANSSSQFEVLTGDQCQFLISSAIDVLEITGVKFYHEKALEILNQAGCDVENELVRISNKIIEKSLRLTPERVVLYNSRNNKSTLKLENNNIYFGAGLNSNHVIDPVSQKKIKINKEMITKASKMIDVLNNIDFLMVLADNIKGSDIKSDLESFKIQIFNSSKPVIVTYKDIETNKKIIKMSEILAGGEDQLRQYPFVSLYAEAETPLQHNREGINKLLLAAEKSLPIIYTSRITAGDNAPMSLAGSLIMALSELISALVLMQAINEGNSFIMGSVFNLLDNERGVNFSSAPESYLMRSAMADILTYFKIPSFSISGNTDAKMVDAQAMIEDALSIYISSQSKSNLNHGVGNIENNSVFSFENLVISDDLIGMSHRIVDGIDVNDETLALDVIHEIGPGNHFLGHEHTMKYFKKETWYPDLFNRERFENWKNDGSKTLFKRANDKTQEILNNYETEALDKEIEDKINDYLEENT